MSGSKYNRSGTAASWNTWRGLSRLIIEQVTQSCFQPTRTTAFPRRIPNIQTSCRQRAQYLNLVRLAGGLKIQISRWRGSPLTKWSTANTYLDSIRPRAEFTLIPQDNSRTSLTSSLISTLRSTIWWTSHPSASQSKILISKTKCWDKPAAICRI